MNTVLPTQIGYTPTGSASGAQLVIGRNTTANWEAIGFGNDGRPDANERLVINLTYIDKSFVEPKLIHAGTAYLDANSLFKIIQQSITKSNAGVKESNGNPIKKIDSFEFSLKEVFVCEDTDGDGVADLERSMLVFASQTFPTGLVPK